jgi:tetratricopeptide (TPR) repeat protein
MKGRIAILATLTLISMPLTVAAGAQATNPPYLREFPSVGRVLREIKGTDAIDTAARQSVVFNSLRMIILQLVGASKRLGERSDTTRTPDEDRLMTVYLEAWHHLMDMPSSTAEKERYDKLVTSYIDSRGFSTDEILRRHFSPEFRASYYRVTRKQQQPPGGSAGSASKAARGVATTPEEALDYMAGLASAQAAVALGKAFLEGKKDSAAKRQFAEAIETFKGLIDKYPGYTQPYVQLAEIYQTQGEYGLAIEYWKRDLSIKPDDWYAFDNLAVCYERLGDYPSALAAAEQAAKLKPEDAVLQHDVGSLYVKVGRKQEALRVYRKLLTLDKQRAQRLYAEINKMK